MLNLLYDKNTTFGRLYSHFYAYFSAVSTPTAHTLVLFLISMLALESADSVRFVYRHFMRRIWAHSLNALYHALSYAKVDYSRFMGVTARMAASCIDPWLESQPVFILIDDTMAEKKGKKFEGVSKLFDHAAHNGSSYLNGHCFVSISLCIPVLARKHGRCDTGYRTIPLGFRMWRKGGTSKLQLASDMVRAVMPELPDGRRIVILCDSWYAKKCIFSLAAEFRNLGIICNVRIDTALYEPAPPRTGKRGRPATHGPRLSLDDFELSHEKAGGFFIGTRPVLANLLKGVPLQAFVTGTERVGGSRRLFLSTLPAGWLDGCLKWDSDKIGRIPSAAWHRYKPLFLYSLRWGIETGYYESKMFWSLCKYMVRSRHGIEMLVNLICVAYAGMKLLPFVDGAFSAYADLGPQEFRFVLSKQIREQVFLSTFGILDGIGQNSPGLGGWLSRCSFFHRNAA